MSITSYRILFHRMMIINSNTNNTENVSDIENLDVDDSFSTTTNNSITTVSNCSRNKRPIPFQSVSSITKKTKSS